jgi:putative transposase
MTKLALTDEEKAFNKAEKNLKIKESLLATAKRRENQICKVIKLKLDESHFSKVQIDYFNMIFIEKKRLYNHIVSELKAGSPLSSIDTRIKTILVSKLNPEYKEEDFINEKFIKVEYNLKYLNSKIVQGVITEVKNSLSGLKALKSKGFRVGKLRYAKFSNSIELSQYKNQYEIINSKLRLAISREFSKSLDKNQKFKLIRTHGSEQLTSNMELTSAKIVRKPSGLYLHITTYQEKVALQPSERTVGIDLGIKNNITLSDGKVFNGKFPIPESLKRLQRKVAKQILNSKNRIKTKKKIEKQYEKLTNKKENQTNQIVAAIKKEYGSAVFQDDNIQSWKNTKGKSRVIQNSILGRLKKSFKENNFKKLGKWIPTTKLCYCCLKLNKCPEGQDMYLCSCGLHEQRDIKAAKTILYLGQELIKFDITKNSYVKKPEALNQRLLLEVASPPQKEVNNNLIINNLSNRNDEIIQEAPHLKGVG